MAAILEAFIAFFKAIPILSKLFTKTEAQKQDEINASTAQESANMKDTGRPTWKN